MKRTVCITGATKGIGLAIAQYLDKDHYHVVGIARSEPTISFPGTLYLADLSNSVETEAVLTKIQQAHTVDCLINNVGIAQPQSLEAIQLSDFTAVLDLNLRPALQALQKFTPTMKQQQWGRVINIASRALLGKVGRTSYSAAKAALVAMTRTVALELAPFGITVNAIAPGPVNTEAFFENHPAGSPALNKLISVLPIGRIGEPEEIAYAAAFFLNEQASFITGQTLFVDGGGSIGIQGS